MIWPEPKDVWSTAFILYTATVGFFGPLLIICLCYLLIVIKVDISWSSLKSTFLSWYSFLSQQKGMISILVIIIQIFLLLFCRWSPLGHGLVSLNADAQSAKWPEWWWWLWWCLCSAGCRSSSSIWSIWWSSSRSPVPLLASTSLLSSCLMPTHVPIRFSMVSYQTTLNRASEKYVGFLLTIAVLLKPAN